MGSVPGVIKFAVECGHGDGWAFFWVVVEAKRSSQAARGASNGSRSPINGFVIGLRQQLQGRGSGWEPKQQKFSDEGQGTPTRSLKKWSRGW